MGDGACDAGHPHPASLFIRPPSQPPSQATARQELRLVRSYGASGATARQGLRRVISYGASRGRSLKDFPFSHYSPPRGRSTSRKAELHQGGNREIKNGLSLILGCDHGYFRLFFKTLGGFPRGHKNRPREAELNGDTTSRSFSTPQPTAWEAF